MSVFRTYIQQLNFDGLKYTKGDVVDILSTFRIACQELPFVLFPESKELATRDWVGEDGLDVYIPHKTPLKHFDFEAVFLYKGKEKNIRVDIANFIAFLYGRNNNATGCRLAIYDEQTKIGYKDVVVSSVENQLYYLTRHDPDAVAKFKVKFTVYDPTTLVTAEYADGEINDLKF